MKELFVIALIAAALCLPRAHAAVVTSDGSDGVFHATVDAILAVDADAVFNFTDFTIDPGVTVRIGPQGYAGPVSLLASQRIFIGGTLDFGLASPVTLAAPTIDLSGGLAAPVLSLNGGNGTLLDPSGNPAGSLTTSNGGDVTAGGNVCLSPCSLAPGSGGSVAPGSGQILLSGGASGVGGLGVTTSGTPGTDTAIVVAPLEAPLPPAAGLLVSGLGVLAFGAVRRRRV